MNLQQAKALKRGQIIFAIPSSPLFTKGGLNADGSAYRFQVTSIKTWKTRPEAIEVRLKRGLREFARMHEEDLKHFSLTDQT